MHQVNIDEAKKRLSELIEAAAKGEDVIITVEGLPKVKLVPVTARGRQARFGSAKGLIAISDDFDAPLPDFGAYMP